MMRIARTLTAGMASIAVCAGLAGALEPAFLAVAAGVEPRAAAAAADAAGSLYFPPTPGEWETIAPAAAGWDAAALDAALDYAGEQRSSGVVILHRGRIVAERYWELEPDPKDPQDRVHHMTTGKTAAGHAIEDVASVQKSVMSFLAGVARGKGLLDFEAPVSRYLGKGWSKATPEAEDAITVRHLLSMSSGLKVDLSLETPAGGKWMYNTPAYSRMVQVIEKASGLSVDVYTRDWLTARIGMSDTRWTPRPWLATAGEKSEIGNTIGLSTSARDLARFGLLVLDGGRWNGEDILGDARYFDQAWQPSQPHHPQYGLLWWLNGQPRGASTAADGAGAAAAKGPLISTAPADLVAAQGDLGRKLYVVRSLDLVVTRLGDAPAKDFNVELWRRLMAAAPRAGS